VIAWLVDLQTGAPPALHLVQQVKQALRLGQLQARDQLPYSA
jgi:hypothetical protein